MKKKLVSGLTTVVLFISLPAFSQNSVKRKSLVIRKSNSTGKAANVKKAAATSFQYFVVKSDSLTFGYRIYADGYLYIEQNSVPVIQGNRGFADTIAAAKAAQLVIQKIKKGEMPPTLTAADLKMIGVQ